MVVPWPTGKICLLRLLVPESQRQDHAMTYCQPNKISATSVEFKPVEVAVSLIIIFNDINKL